MDKNVSGYREKKDERQETWDKRRGTCKKAGNGRWKVEGGVWEKISRSSIFSFLVPFDGTCCVFCRIF